MSSLSVDSTLLPDSVPFFLLVRNSKRVFLSPSAELSCWFFVLSSSLSVPQGSNGPFLLARVGFYSYCQSIGNSFWLLASGIFLPS